MGQSVFYRNVDNYDQLLYFIRTRRGITANYTIIHRIKLSEEDFRLFCGDFQMHNDFLLPYIDETIIRNNVWNCIAVSGQSLCFLVLMNGYQYPRYIGILQ